MWHTGRYRPRLHDWAGQDRSWRHLEHTALSRSTCSRQPHIPGPTGAQALLLCSRHCRARARRPAFAACGSIPASAARREAPLGAIRSVGQIHPLWPNSARRLRHMGAVLGTVYHYQHFWISLFSTASLFIYVIRDSCSVRVFHWAESRAVTTTTQDHPPAHPTPPSPSGVSIF